MNDVDIIILFEQLKEQMRKVVDKNEMLEDELTDSIRALRRVSEELSASHCFSCNSRRDRAVATPNTGCSCAPPMPRVMYEELRHMLRRCYDYMVERGVSPEYAIMKDLRKTLGI